MKSLISLGIALFLPFLMHAQTEEKTIFGNISDVYLNYKFSANFDHMLSNQLGLGIELYDNFDFEFVVSNHSILEHEFVKYDIIGGVEVLEEQFNYKANGHTYGLALSYRAFADKNLSPIIGIGWEMGKLRNFEFREEPQFEYFYGRLGVEYNVLPWLIVSGNLNIVNKYAHMHTYGDMLARRSNQFLSLGARFSFDAID